MGEKKFIFCIQEYIVLSNDLIFLWFKEYQWTMPMPCKARPVTVAATPQTKMDSCWRKERNPWNRSPSQNRPWSTGQNSCHPHPSTRPRPVKWTCLSTRLETPRDPSSTPRSTVWAARWGLAVPCPPCLRYPPVPVLSLTMPPPSRAGTCRHTQTPGVSGVVPPSTLRMCTTPQISIMWFKGLSPPGDRIGATVREVTTPGVRERLRAWMLHGAHLQTLSVGHVTVIKNRVDPCRNSKATRLCRIVKTIISSYMSRSRGHLGPTPTCPTIVRDISMCGEMGASAGSMLVSLASMSPARLSIITSKWSKLTISNISLLSFLQKVHGYDK